MMRCLKLSLKIDAFFLSIVLVLSQCLVFAVSFADSMPGPLSITSNKSNQVLNHFYNSHHHLVRVNPNELGAAAAESTPIYKAWWLWLTVVLCLCVIPILIYCCCCRSSGEDDAKEEKGKSGKDDKAKTGKEDKGKTGKEDKAKTGKEDKGKSNKEAKAKTNKDEKAKTNKEGKPPAGKQEAKTNKA